MSTNSDWDIIDFHTHIRPPGSEPLSLPGVQFSDSERAAQQSRFRRLVDVDGLVRESEENGIRLRILSATIEGFFGTTGPTDIDRIRRVNDFLAETQRAHAGKFLGLATIDAFSGEVGAREVERAVLELNLAGIVIDSSRDQRYPGDAVARPALEAAAALKVPVFIHPVGAPCSEQLSRNGGVPAYALGRGFVNGLALLSVLRSGVMEELPDLHVIFTALGSGALWVAAEETAAFPREKDLIGARPNIYFDIMGFHPATIRYLVDFLGAGRVVTGSDWPICRPLSRTALAAAFESAGLNPEQQQLVAEGNVRRLLSLRAA